LNKQLSQIIDWKNDNGVAFGIISDRLRNQFYDNSFKNNVTNKHCIDIGFGTGLLSFLALKYNPKHITAFESNSIRYEFGLELIKNLKLENKITLINATFNSSYVNKEHDLIFHEIVDNDIWGEGLTTAYNNTHLPIIPSKYCCDFYLYKCSDGFTNQIVQEKPNEWADIYDAVSGADWPRCLSPMAYDKLPNWVKAEINESYPDLIYKFNPHVEFDVDYITELQKYLDIFWENKKHIPTARLITNNNNKDAYSIAINSATKIISYSVDLTNNIAEIAYLYNDTQEIVSINKQYIDLRLDKSLLANGEFLILPNNSLQHNEYKLNLVDSHWLVPSQSIITNNVLTDIVIRQYFDVDSGIRIINN
jgi:hypothetical protein